MDYTLNKGTELTATVNNLTGLIRFQLFNRYGTQISEEFVPVQRHDWTAPLEKNTAIFNKPLVMTEEDFNLFKTDYAYNAGSIENSMYLSVFKRYHGGIDIVLEGGKVEKLWYVEKEARSNNGLGDVISSTVHNLSRANNRLRRLI